MLGLMQDWPLLCHRIIDHAATYHAERPVISRSVEGPIHTTNYAEIRKRALQRGAAAGAATASSSATAWRRSPGIPGGISNAWYGILGIGAIYHTVNPRLFPDQIAWIINHAEDRVMIDRPDLPADPGKARRQAADHRALCRADRRRAYAGDHAEERRRLRGLDRARSTAISPGSSFDENTAAGMCYTSGTTGNPKGVLYSHRSNVLHSMMASMPRRHGRARRATSSCRWCRCSTPIAGALR